MLYNALSVNEDIINEYYTKFEDFRSNVETSNYFIHVCNSFFKGCNKATKGAAINYVTSNGKLFVEFSTFNNCFTTGTSNTGGCIYAEQCDCVIYCVCSNGCYAKDTSGQFITSVLSNGESDKLNFVISSSICFIPEGSYGRPMYIKYGKQFCTSINVSQNKVKEWSGIEFIHGTGTPLVSFCSFNSNTADYGCLFFQISDYIESYEMMNCNIISNTQNNPTASNNLIHCMETTNIYFCCILGNTDSKLFRADAQITLYDSTIPNKFGTLGAYSVNTNYALTESFINYLKFTYKEDNCDVGLESFNGLTPVYDVITTINAVRELSEEEFSQENNVLLFSQQRNTVETSYTYILKGSLPTINISSTNSKEDDVRKVIVQSHHKYLSSLLTLIKLLLSPTFLFNFIIHSRK